MSNSGIFSKGSINLWIANPGTTDQGETLSLDKDDLLLRRVMFKESYSGILGTNNLNSAYLEVLDAFDPVEANLIRIQGSGSWNHVKSFKLTGRAEDLGDASNTADGKSEKDLEVYNFVHANVKLSGKSEVGADVMIDGAKRGDIRLTHHDDELVVGVSSNGSGWRNSFKINARDGDDTILLRGAIDDYKFGSRENDTTGKWTSTRISGGKGDDVIDASSLSSADTLRGGQGNDIIRAGGGDDKLVGHHGEDLLFGGSGADDLRGGSDNDLLVGGAGDDILRGNRGEDILIGDNHVRVTPGEAQSGDLDFVAASNLGDALSDANMDGVTIMGRNIVNGELSALSADVLVLDQNHGLGISGQTNSKSIANQLGYNAAEELSESIVIEFDNFVTDLEIDLKRLFDDSDFSHVNVEALETARYVLRLDGKVVESGVLSPVNKDGNIETYHVGSNKTYDSIELSAVPYNNDSNNAGVTNDSSDYFLAAIRYETVEPVHVEYGPQMEHVSFDLESMDAVNAALAEAGITVRARNINKEANDGEGRLTNLENDNVALSQGTSRYPEKGIGASSEAATRPSVDTETGYDPVTEFSELLEFDLDKPATAMELDLALFFSDADGNTDLKQTEVLKYSLYSEGKVVAEDVVVYADQIRGGDQKLVVDVPAGQVFDVIQLEALPYSEDPDNANKSNDSSDFLVTAIKVTYQNDASGNDELRGGKDDDILIGGRGDDILNGGQGVDIAVFEGPLEDYTRVLENGHIIITDSQPDRDGQDTIRGVELFQFNKILYTREQILQDIIENQAPEASDDLIVKEDEAFTFEEDEALAMLEVNVLTGLNAAGFTGAVADSDPENDPISVIAISKLNDAANALTVAPGAPIQIEGLYGTLTIASDGTATYVRDDSKTQALNVNDTVMDDFSYTISDGDLEDTAILSISIKGTNDAPVAVVTMTQAMEDMDYVLTLADFGLDRPEAEVDIDDVIQDMVVRITVSPNLGALVDTNGMPLASSDITYAELVGGNVIYRSNPDANGQDALSYRLVDPQGAESDEVMLTIDVAAVNDAPVAVDDTLAVNDTVDAMASMVGNVLSNDTDPDGDQLTVASVSNVALTLPASYAGLTMDALLIVPVVPDPMLNEFAKYTITPQGDLANDDTLGGIETPAELIIKTDGSVELIKNNAFNFIPDGESIELSFDYVVNDGALVSNAATATLQINGTDNNDLILLNAQSGSGGADDDVLNGGNDTVQISGDVFDNMSLFTNAGSDTLNGGAGNDLLIGDVEFNSGTIGFAGNDTLNGGAGGDRLWGDVALNFSGATLVTAGDDTLNGGDGDDLIYGDIEENQGTLTNAGNDTLIGGEGADFLIGDVASNLETINQGTLTNAGNDTLIGGAGDDLFVGDVNSNTGVIGVAGNDTFNGGDGGDAIIGDVTVNNVMIDTAGNDTFNGGDGNDVIIGDVQENNGTLTTAGDDTLIGGEGNDQLVGDVGINNGMVTNYGSDTFEFDASTNFGDDRIFDFNVGGTDDVLRFTNLAGSGNLVSDLEGQSRVEDNGAGNVRFVSVGFGGVERGSIVIDGLAFDANRTEITDYLAVKSINGRDIELSGVLMPPVAADDTLAAVDDTVDAMASMVGNVLSNDTDPDNDPLMVASVQNVALTLPASYAGLTTDTLLIEEVTMGLAADVAAKYTITPQGDLANDATLGGIETPAELIIKTDGSVELIKNNAFNFIPDGENIELSFDYVANDGVFDSNAASATLQINGTDNNDLILKSSGFNSGFTLVQGDDADDVVIARESGQEFLMNGEAFSVNALITQAGDDLLMGGAGNDRLHGEANAISDVITQAGDDLLMGGAGNDNLYGESFIVNATGIIETAGNDTLIGGAGDDALFGDVNAIFLFGTVTNYGSDTFEFDASTSFGNDRILDFNAGGTDDVLRFTNVGSIGDVGVFLRGISEVLDDGTGNVELVFTSSIFSTGEGSIRIDDLAYDANRTEITEYLNVSLIDDRTIELSGLIDPNAVVV